MGAGSVEAVVEDRNPAGNQLDLGSGEGAAGPGGGRIADQAVIDVVGAPEIVQGPHPRPGQGSRPG